MNNMVEQLLQFMGENTFLTDIILILLVVKGAGFLSRKIGQPAILGNMLAGIIIGPALLGWVEQSIWIKQLADIGVIMLMFLAGLETDWPMFKANMTSGILVAIGGVILPALGGWWIGSLWGYDQSIAILIGVVLLATSVSITVESLRELGWLKSKEGMTILGAAVLDDILGLLVLSIALNVALGNNQGGNLAFLLAQIVVFFVFVLLFKGVIMPWLVQIRSYGPLVIVLSLMFAFALIAQFFGLANIIGAYFAGIIIGQSPWGCSRLNHHIEFLGNNFFFPIFFANLGLVANFHGINSSMIYLGAVLTIVAILSKIIGAGFGAMLAGSSLRSSLLIGTGMVSRGEVALLVTNIGFTKGLFSQDLYTILLVVTIITTVITPVLVKKAIRFM